MKTSEYVFDDVDKLAGYIENKLANPTPLKVQKSLYFLWAYYSATFGNLSSNKEENEEFGLQPPYPSELFKPDFEAWRYGPVINSVYADYKSNNITTLNDDELKGEMNFDNKNEKSEGNKKEIISFINDLLDQVDDVNDFGLVQRSHEDSAWKDAYEEGAEHCKMSSEQIKADYIEYVND